MWACFVKSDNKSKCGTNVFFLYINIVYDDDGDDDGDGGGSQQTMRVNI